MRIPSRFAALADYMSARATFATDINHFEENSRVIWLDDKVLAHLEALASKRGRQDVYSHAI